MTDSDKLDLILSKVDSLENRFDSLEGRFDTLEGRVSSLEDNLNSFKQQVNDSINDLKDMDRIILDEVERVHTILTKHTTDKSVHTEHDYKIHRYT